MIVELKGIMIQYLIITVLQHIPRTLTTPTRVKLYKETILSTESFQTLNTTVSQQNDTYETSYPLKPVTRWYHSKVGICVK